MIIMNQKTLFVLVLLSSIFLIHGVANATSYLTFISNKLTSSARGAQVNQTIRFTLNQAVPPSGAVEILFSGGGFLIPSSGFNFGDVFMVYFQPGQTGIED